MKFTSQSQNVFSSPQGPTLAQRQCSLVTLHTLLELDVLNFSQNQVGELKLHLFNPKLD